MKQFTMSFNSHYLIHFAIYLIAINSGFTSAIAQNRSETSKMQERELIRQEKVEIESSYKEKEAACFKKFIASPCVDDAKQQKTKALAKLKQRELALNEEDRALKKAKIQSKQIQTQEQIKASDAQANAEDRAIEAQTQRQQQKQLQTQTQAKLRVEKTDKKKAVSANKAQRRAEKSKQESVNSVKYQNKVAAAQARKKAIDEKNANRNKPKAASLPSPNTN